MCCLVEPRRAFPIEHFGILEAYLPAERIEIIAATTTLTSIFLSGLCFFQVYGLPDKRENRLLGRAKHVPLKEDGVLSGFMNLTHLSPSNQSLRLEAYEAEIQGVVRGFLTQFSVHQTFHRNPQVVIKLGAYLTILQKHLLRRLCNFSCFMKHCKESFFIFDSMDAMTTKEPTGIAEIALQFYDDIKGPLENRITVLKALGVHMKDLTSAAAHLVTASDPIPCPTIRDLEDWTGVKSQSAQMELLRDVQGTVVECQIHMEKMAVMMTAMLKKMNRMEQAAMNPPMKASVTPEPTVPALEREQPENPTGGTSYSQE